MAGISRRFASRYSARRCALQGGFAPYDGLRLQPFGLDSVLLPPKMWSGIACAIASASPLFEGDILPQTPSVQFPPSPTKCNKRTFRCVWHLVEMAGIEPASESAFTGIFSERSLRFLRPEGGTFASSARHRRSEESAIP